jgi:hypothetical protein
VVSISSIRLDLASATPAFLHYFVVGAFYEARTPSFSAGFVAVGSVAPVKSCNALQLYSWLSDLGGQRDLMSRDREWHAVPSSRMLPGCHSAQSEAVPGRALWRLPDTPRLPELGSICGSERAMELIRAHLRMWSQHRRMDLYSAMSDDFSTAVWSFASIAHCLRKLSPGPARIPGQDPTQSLQPILCSRLQPGIYFRRGTLQEAISRLWSAQITITTYQQQKETTLCTWSRLFQQLSFWISACRVASRGAR